MMWVIGIILITLTICILKDTHIKEYTWDFRRNLVEEYDLKLPVWLILVILLLGSIPVINITIFLAFIGYYIAHVVSDMDSVYTGYIWKPSLKGKNWVTKAILFIKRLLCAKV
jgi:hypothetical protein